MAYNAFEQLLLSDAPAVCWAFQELVDGTTVADISGNGRDGTKYGTGITLGSDPITSRDKASGYFPGINSVSPYWASNGDTTDTDLDVGTGDFCFVFTSKFETPGHGSFKEIFSRDYDGSGYGPTCYLEAGNYCLRFWVGNQLFQGKTNITNGADHVIHIQRRAGYVELYVDGRLDCPSRYTAYDVSSGSRPLRFGYCDGDYGGMEGNGAYFTYYTKSLTPKTIAIHAVVHKGLGKPKPTNDNFKATVLEKSPTNYWPSNEGTGTPIDIVANHTTTKYGTLNWTDEDHFGEKALEYADNQANYIGFSELEDTGAFTWMLAANPYSTDQVMMLVSEGDRGYFTIQASDAVWIQVVYPDGFPVELTRNHWFLFILKRSASNVWTLYVNGKKIPYTITDSDAMRVSQFARYNAGGYSFHGQMNHIARWSGVDLSDDDAADLFLSWNMGGRLAPLSVPAPGDGATLYVARRIE